MTDHLNPSALAGLAADILQPTYDRDATGTGIVHLGIGAFHRAHQAVYTDLAMNRSGGDWGIVGVSLRSDSAWRQLQPQQGLYSVLSEDAERAELRVVGAVQRVIVAPREPQAVLRAMADPAVHIVSLTVTEKGYCLGHDGRTLDRDDPGLAADLANPEQPVTAIGLLSLGLRRRQLAGGAPLTVLSCDNLSHNGAVLRGLVREFLAETQPAVLDWLEQSVSFPCSMVDRIVPAATEPQRARQSRMLGCEDAAAIATEPFMQWLVEDCFAGPRPDWGAVGVQFVDDIAPYEAIKLRLLNASHSAIAYMGLLAGHDTVDQVMADPALRRYVETLMRTELQPALQAPAGFDLDAYGAQLLERFANPCLAHRCEQIAMDGSEKIPQRWLATLQCPGERPLLLRALAAWCHHVLLSERSLDDPAADRLLALRVSDRPLRERVAAALACARVDAGSISTEAAPAVIISRLLERAEGAGVDALLA